MRRHRATQQDKTPRELELEKITGKKALHWVADQNQKTLAIFQKTFQKFKKIIYSNEEETPDFSNIIFDGETLFQKTDQRWKKTTLEECNNGNMRWRTIRDIDSTPEPELQNISNRYVAEDWEYQGAIYSPDDKRAMAHFSFLHESTISVFREYDLETDTFIKGGFEIPPSQSEVLWKDNDSLLIITSIGKNSLNDAGRPRQLKLWQRGVSLRNARIIFEGEKTDRSLIFSDFYLKDKHFLAVIRYFSGKEKYFLIESNLSVSPFLLPPLAEVLGCFDDYIIVHLKQNWSACSRTFFKEGSIVAFKPSAMQAANYSLIFQPTDTCIFRELDLDSHSLIITLSNNVSDELYRVELINEKWILTRIPLPDKGSIKILKVKDHGSLISYENFITPPTLYCYNSVLHIASLLKLTPCVQQAIETKQFFAKSLDGTQIPFFVTHHKNTQYTGSNPTLLHGYGGFELSILPQYLSINHRKLWLEKGGVYVSANIRGGLEYGNQWHASVLKENRHKVFEDFIAIAEELIHKKITSPKFLGIRGASNGGLLVAAVFTMRPDLFNAVVCKSPVLNMLNYHTFFENSKEWIDEYGDPDDRRMQKILKKYSPYHNILAGQTYPEVLFMTSTNDNIVHPSHVRNMVNKMQALGHKVYYYETREGGHSMQDTYDAYIDSEALIFSFLQKQLMCNYETTRRPALSGQQPLGSNLANNPATLFSSSRRSKRKCSEETMAPSDKKLRMA